jgi:hypothetical protein
MTFKAEYMNITCDYKNLSMEYVAPTYGTQTCYIALTVDKKDFVLNVSYTDGLTLSDTYSSKNLTLKFTVV